MNKYKIAVQALRDITNPLEKIKREMDENYILDGPGCVAYLNSIHTYKGIAQDALRKLGEDK